MSVAHHSHARTRSSGPADQLGGVLDEIIAATGRRPVHFRMDNGTEMTAHAMRDWCRFTGVDASFIDPGSPCRNDDGSVPALRETLQQISN